MGEIKMLKQIIIRTGMKAEKIRNNNGGILELSIDTNFIKNEYKIQACYT